MIKSIELYFMHYCFVRITSRKVVMIVYNGLDTGSV